MEGFQQVVEKLTQLQNESQKTIRLLQAENERLKSQLQELKTVNHSTADERPVKHHKSSGTSTLHATTAIQRLVATASPRPHTPTRSFNIPEEPEGEEDEEANNEEDDYNEEDNGNEISKGKARFRLIAHSGDEREEISPRDREITIPVLVKSYVELAWIERPQNVLVMMRPGDGSDDLSEIFIEIAKYLWARNVKIIIETDMEVKIPSTENQLVRAEYEDLHKHPIDFIVTLGGDGTFIRAAYAFPRACPPILAFAFGSLGFLTPFPASSIDDSLDFVLGGAFGLRLRARLELELHRRDCKEPEVFQVLNECVIDRGSTSSLVRLILYSNRDGSQPVTIVQGDGLILATPTGSTAYSLSAGGSMVHPSVPAILVTPICPHSLSFRPILVPDSATLRIQVAPDARNSAWMKIDGRKTIEFKQGDEFIIRYSSYPVPAIMTRRTDQGDADGWLSSLKTALHWNVIQVQKPLKVVGTDT